ncbi:hypothetical protein VNO77_37754 [Canavalia gladiata]|uniref:Uncharacterized protein n=1 Tax=Canavalia gladiata TaxID=3824 RepID=A0AAN9KBD7_CANGL
MRNRFRIRDNVLSSRRLRVRERGSNLWPKDHKSAIAGLFGSHGGMIKGLDRGYHRRRRYLRRFGGERVRDRREQAKPTLRAAREGPCSVISVVSDEAKTDDSHLERPPSESQDVGLQREVSREDQGGRTPICKST